MRTNTTAPTLTRAAFTAWLAQFPDEWLVGIAKALCECPIARCISATNQIATVAVDNKTIRWWSQRGERHHKATPAWAGAFIDLLDETPGPVTAGTAREILARIPDESEAAQ